MGKIKKSTGGLDELHEVRYAGFRWSRRDKRDRTKNRRAGLHDKKNILEGETRVKRRKPLALKHVRRMRKLATALSLVFVAGVVALGVGFFTKTAIEDLPDADFATVCFKKPEDGTRPTDHTLVENVGYLNYVLQSQPYWSSNMNSTVNAPLGIKQYVKNHKMYYNDVLISEDEAEGASTAATQFCVKEQLVLWRPSTTGRFGSWSTEEMYHMPVSVFKKKRGLPPTEFSVYILNELTINNAQEYSVNDNGDGTYTMKLNLNVNTGNDETSADFYYKQQMAITGSLDSTPQISSTSVTYVFDSDWRVLSFYIEDAYWAQMGISAYCTSNTYTVFSYKEEDAANALYEDVYEEPYEQYKNDASSSEEDITKQPSAMNYLAAAFGSVLEEGAVFKIDLDFDEFSEHGVVYVGMEDKALSSLRVKLGDILVWMDKDSPLYVTDGVAKYKLGIGGLLASSASEEGATGGFNLDMNALTTQLAGGEFTVDEENGKATLQSALELFGLKVNLVFDFNVEGKQVSLGFVKAEIPVGEKLLNAKLCFGDAGDIPAVPHDTAGYKDILNGGVALDISVTLDNMTLNGTADIITENGEFKAVYVTLDGISVYYDYAAGTIYLSDGTAKYKLSIDALSAGTPATTAEGLDLNALIKEVISNLSAKGGTISTNASLEVLGMNLQAALDIALNGGIKIGADIKVENFNISAGVSLSDREIVIPDLTGYKDILNGGVALDISVTLDDMTLDGTADIITENGEFKAVYVTLDGISVYYDYAAGTIYLSDGTAKYKLSIDALSAGTPATTAEGLDLNALIKEVISNLSANDGTISTSASLDILGMNLQAALDIVLNGGIKIGADIKVENFNISAGVSLSDREIAIPDLTDYKDILNGGVALDISLTLDDMTLNGTADIITENGEFVGVYVTLDSISVYYDYSESMLYISDGNAKYKLSIDALSGTPATTGEGLDLNALIKEVISNLSAKDGTISTSASLDILGMNLQAALDVVLNGGIKIGADVKVGNFNISAGVALSDREIAVPELTGYKDILNGGVALDISVTLDNMTLDGTADIITENGEFVGVYVTLDSISVYYDYSESMLYISDGNAKYKLSIDALSGTPATTAEGLDLNALLKEVIANLSAKDGTISTSASLDILGMNLQAALDVVLNGGIKIGADVKVGNFNISAGVALSDREIAVPELTGYKDILNGGVALDISVTLDNMTLDGTADIITENGEFIGVYVTLDSISVYYDYVAGTVYLSDGNAKYKLSIDALSSGTPATTAEGLDLNALLKEVIANLSAKDGTISTNASLDILGMNLQAALDVVLNGGIKIGADVKLGNFNISAGVALSDRAVEVPELTGYKDILNSEVTLDVTLKLDGLTLTGTVGIGLSEGEINYVAADFGYLAVYYTASDNALYIKCGETKAKICLTEMQAGAIDMSALFDGVSFEITELLGNVTEGLKEISASGNVTLKNDIIPIFAALGLNNGICVKAELMLLGIELSAEVGFSSSELGAISEEQAGEYTDVLKDTWALVHDLIGKNITLAVAGTIYSEEEKYADYENVAYDFKATVEYDEGENGFPVTEVDGEVFVDSTMYLHIGLELNARSAEDESVYFDLWILDAAQSSDGEYIADGALDLYLYISKYTEGGNPMKLYAPVDSVLSLVAMVGAAANLDSLGFEDSEELTTLVGKISEILDKLLITKYLPYTNEQFASLGDSLIPQILGTDLQGLLSGLLGSAKAEEEEGDDSTFSLTDKYIDSISYGNDSLKIVLNSSLIFGGTVNEEDNLAIQLSLADVDGVPHLSQVSANNIYLGSEMDKKLDLSLNLGYGNAVKPDAATVFAGFMNLDGIDTLLKSFVNSATHKSDIMDSVDSILYAGATSVPSYLLNHDYYIEGTLQLTLGDYLVPVQVQGLSAHIDEHNDVSINASLFIQKKTVHLAGMIPVTIVNADTYVNLTIKDGLLYLKRTVGAQAEYRIMTLTAFINDIMSQIKYMFNLGSTVGSIIDMATGSGGDNGYELTFDDYGDYIGKFISRYQYDGEANSWLIDINDETLSGLANMTLSGVEVSIGASKSSINDGLVVDALGIKLSMFDMIHVSGSLNFLNPQYVWKNGADKSASTTDLSTAKIKELNGLSWTEILTGRDYKTLQTELIARNEEIALMNKQIEEANKALPEEERVSLVANVTVFDVIKEHTDWSSLVSYLNTADYLRFGSGVNLSLGSVQYLIEREEGGNIESVEFIDTVDVLYYGERIFTRHQMDLEKIRQAAANRYGDIDRYDDLAYSSDAGEFKYEFRYKATEYDRVDVTLASKVPAKGYAFNGATGLYEKPLSFISGSHVRLGAANDLNAYTFGGFYATADFAGEQLTEFTAYEGLRIYVNYIPKEVRITYVSDVEFTCEHTTETVEGSVLYYIATPEGTFNFDTMYVNNSVAVADTSVQFFGWYIKLDDGTYSYIYDAAALRAVIDGMDFADSEVIEVELSAVWISKDFNVTTVSVQKESSRWSFVSKFECVYVGNMSNNIVAVTDVSSRFVANVKYHIQGKNLLGSTKNDTLNSNKYTTISGQYDVGLAGMTSGNAITWNSVSGATQVKLEITFGNGTILLGEKTSAYVASNA